MGPKPSKRSQASRRRIAVGVAVICAAVIAPLALAAGKPGNFKLAPTSPETVSGNPAGNIVAAKLDDERGTDLAIVNSDTSIAILSGGRDGDFTEIGTETVIDRPQEITAADLDGVNGTDLAVSSGPFATSGVTILLNDGTGDFTEPATSPEDAAGGGITSADLDGDDDLDLAVGCLVADCGEGPLESKAVVLLNDGSGDFSAGDSFSLPETAAVENADLDDDDDRDVVGLDQLADTARVSFNDGDGNFTDGAQLASAGGQVLAGLAVGRIGRGPSPDIAVGTHPGGVVVFLNDGDGGFEPSPRSPLAPGRTFEDVHITDIDGDGRGDVFAGEATDGVGFVPGVAVFLSRGAGGFKEPGTSPELIPGVGAGGYHAVGRFDRGKLPDIAAGGPNVSILLNRSP